MGANFHTAWAAGVTNFSADSMEPSISNLDRAITYLKNVVITCNGAITYNSTSGVLTWAGNILIFFNTAGGTQVYNSITASNITLADGEMIYVNLSETNGATVSFTKVAIGTGGVSASLAYNRLLMGYRNTTDDKLYGPLQALVTGNYVDQDVKVAASPTFANITSNADIVAKGKLRMLGTTGGYRRNIVEGTASIGTASNITLTLNIPTNARLLGAQFRVDSALATADPWDAAFVGGSSATLATNQAVAKNTRLSLMLADLITTGTTQVRISKFGGGAFTARSAVIRAICYYEDFATMATLA